MYILAIETTGPVESAAILKIDAEARAEAAGSGVAPQADPGVINSTTEVQDTEIDMVPDLGVSTNDFVPAPMSHLKNLVPMIKELFDKNHITGDDIGLVAASCGPGSYTGIRIGVSTARALAQAWDVPCVKVPTLEVFREKCGGACGGGRSANEAGDFGDGSCAVIFNARRGQVYGACYRGNGEPLIKPGPYMLSDMLDIIEESGIRPVFYGDGIDAYFDKDEYKGRIAKYEAAPAPWRYQTADMAARFAKKKLEKGETAQYGELKPDYMRESEAEQRLKDGSLERMRKAKLARLMEMAGKE